MRRHLGLFERGFPAFSQEGEDLVLARLLGVDGGRARGFYVDVGAHDPERYSNTFLFYQRGWRGLNIDPAPGIRAKFVAARPRDITLEMAVSDNAGEIEYAIFNEPALNGCDVAMASLRDGRNGHRIIQKTRVQARRLDSILDEYLPPATEIVFLNVDVEGHDLAVLRSNAWERYRPHLVLAEDAALATLDDVRTSEIARFLRGVDYVPVSKCALTLIFADRSRICRTELGVRVR
jgi:FkbM family methyltransferase